MAIESNRAQFTDRKVVRRGLLAGLAGLGAAAALKVTGAGKATRAEATDGQSLVIGNIAFSGSAQTAQSITTVNCSPAFDSYGLLVTNGTTPAIPGRIGLGGTSNGATGAGVYGLNTSAGGAGVWGLGSPGMLGHATASGATAVRGITTDSTGFGVQGIANLAGNLATNGNGTGTGVLGRSGGGNAVKAESGTGIAVLAQTGLSGSTTLAAIQGQTSSTGEGVRGVHGIHGIGVLGVTNAGNNFTDNGSGGGTGVRGVSADGFGVQGRASAALGIGVSGVNANNGSGVKGVSNTGANFSADGTGSGIGVDGRSGSGPGVRGESTSGPGVFGKSTSQPGVDGISTNSLGVRGTSTNFVGVVGISTNNHGLYGSSGGAAGIGLVGENTAGGLAGYFFGNVQIAGALQVFGAKNAVIKMQDGTNASVYCQESPEPYFEDFGRGQLAGGVASVQLEREFASLVAGSDYMVFLTPSADTRGLFVTRQNPNGFEVRECQGGTSSIPFTYRVVTKRKDIDGRRFARVSEDAKQSVASARAQIANMPRGNGRNGP